MLVEGDDRASEHCPQCRGLMAEVVSLNRMVDALSSRLDVSVAEFMSDAYRKSSLVAERNANRDAHEADLRLDALRHQREAARLSHRVGELEQELATRRAREDHLQADVEELQERLMSQLSASRMTTLDDMVSSWTQTDIHQPQQHARPQRLDVAHRSPTLSRQASKSHPHDGTSTQGESPSQRTSLTAVSNSRGASFATVSISEARIVDELVGTRWQDEDDHLRSSPNPHDRRSASPCPVATPNVHTVLSVMQRPRAPRLLDGVKMNDIMWPEAFLDHDHDGENADGTHAAAKQRSCERSVSLPSTTSMLSVSLSRCIMGGTPRAGAGGAGAMRRCVTPPSTKHRRAAVYNGPWSSLTYPQVVEPQSPAAESPTMSTLWQRNARTPSFPRVLDNMIMNGSHNVRSSRRQPVPRETQGMLEAALDGLHMLRGLTVRADPNMLRTMTTMHELRDTGCPLKQALTTVKQVLLGAMPSLAARIRDGELWQVRKRDLQALQLEHCSSLATALRSLMVAHDYLRGQERGQAMSSIVELYLNMHIFVALARAPAVQRHFCT